MNERWVETESDETANTCMKCIHLANCRKAPDECYNGYYVNDDTEPTPIPYTPTRRDYFAGLAMGALIATDSHGDIPIKEVAKYSVKYADALIAELDK